MATTDAFLATSSPLQDARPPEPALYIVALPIGNPLDITVRALALLGKVDNIACEDTRVTDRLLSWHGIKARLVCYNDFSTEKTRDYLIDLVKSGKSVALVSDAGTPLISDPGYKLVRAAQEAGLTVVTLPGPSAIIAALTLAGLPTNRFLFEGFLPPKKAARRAQLLMLKPIDATLIFYESPRRMEESLADMCEVLGNREACMARELTKTYEEVVRLPLTELAAFIAANPPRGEVVVLVAPPGEESEDAGVLDRELLLLLPHHSIKDAVAMVAAKTLLPKKQVYARALEMAKQRSDDQDNAPHDDE